MRAVISRRCGRAFRASGRLRCRTGFTPAHSPGRNRQIYRCTGDFRAANAASDPYGQVIFDNSIQSGTQAARQALAIRSNYPAVGRAGRCAVDCAFSTHSTNLGNALMRRELCRTRGSLLRKFFNPREGLHKRSCDSLPKPTGRDSNGNSAQDDRNTRSTRHELRVARRLVVARLYCGR